MPGLALGYISGGKVHDEFLNAIVRFVITDKSPPSGRNIYIGDPGFTEADAGRLMELVQHDEALRLLVHALITDGRNQYLGLCRGGGAFHASNRNRVVNAVITNTTAEWLLFIDSDVDFMPADVYRMLDAAGPDRKIISGLYFVYHPAKQLNPAWYRLHPLTKSYDVVPELGSGLQEIDGCGMGFCLIHREVFLTIEPKYRHDDWIWFGHDLVKMASGPLRLGEDLTFCRRAQEAGFKIWGTGDVSLDHIKEKKVNLAEFARLRGQKVEATPEQQAIAQRALIETVVNEPPMARQANEAKIEQYPDGLSA